MKELELYKLLATEDNKYGVELADEIRWTNNKEELLIWVDYSYLDDFMKAIKELLGNGIFDDESFNGNFQEDSVCFNLKDIVWTYAMDLEKIFPKEIYS